MGRYRSVALICLLCVVPLAAKSRALLAKDAVDSSAPSAQPAVSIEVRPDDDSLLEQLESDRFADRQQATMQLRRRGTAGIPLLQRAAEHGQAETRTRALQLLEEYYRNASEDREDLRDAARQALDRLASGEGTAARRAQAILNPQPQNATMNARVANLQAIQLQGQLRLRAAQRLPAQQIPPAAPNLPPAPPAPGLDENQPANRQPGRRRVATRRMTARQGEQKFRIAEDGDGIHVEVTETKDGEDVTEKFRVKNAEELQARHPQAFDVYRRVQIRPGGLPRGAEGDNAPDGQERQLLDAVADVVRRKIERIDQQMEEVKEQMAAEPKEELPNRAPRSRLERELERLQRTRQMYENHLK